MSMKDYHEFRDQRSGNNVILLIYLFVCFIITQSDDESPGISGFLLLC